MKWRGVAMPMPSWDAASGIIDAGLNKGAIDDRKMLVRTTLQLEYTLLTPHAARDSADDHVVAAQG
jgi:hypothetical protein